MIRGHLDRLPRAVCSRPDKSIICDADRKYSRNRSCRSSPAGKLGKLDPHRENLLQAPVDFRLASSSRWMDARISCGESAGSGCAAAQRSTPSAAAARRCNCAGGKLGRGRTALGAAAPRAGRGSAAAAGSPASSTKSGSQTMAKTATRMADSVPMTTHTNQETTTRIATMISMKPMIQTAV